MGFFLLRLLRDAGERNSMFILWSARFCTFKAMYAVFSYVAEMSLFAWQVSTAVLSITAKAKKKEKEKKEKEEEKMEVVSGNVSKCLLLSEVLAFKRDNLTAFLR